MGTEAVNRIRMAAFFAAAFSICTAMARAEDPLVGRWQMISLTVGGKPANPLPIAITIRQATPSTLKFTYLAGTEEKVNMTFTVPLNGTLVPVHDAAGAQIGTVKLTKLDGGKYELVLQSAGKPPEPGKMVLARQNQILTCSVGAGDDKTPPRIIQVFSRDTL